MSREDFFKKIKDRCLRLAQQGFIPVQAFAGEGVVIIHDSQNEYDTYFDADKWEFVYPEIWEGQIQDGIGVLPGLGRAPRVAGFKDAVRFASRELKGKDQRRRLHRRPHLIES